MKFSDLLSDPNLIKNIVTNIKTLGFSKIESVIPRDHALSLKKQAQNLYREEREKVSRGERENDIDFQTYNFTGAHLYNTPRQSRAFDELIGHKEVVNILDELLGTKAILSQTEIRNPVQHQTDNSYKWHRDGRMLVDADLWLVVFWLLDDVTESNGATQIKPKSHRNNNFDNSSETTSITGSAGDIIIMSNNLLHRATENSNGKDRWIFIPTYNPWFIKPSADFTKMFSKDTFLKFTEEQKQVYGYTSIVPVDERKRLYTLRPWKELYEDIPFLEQGINND